jgi:hypothetical protein
MDIADGERPTYRPTQTINARSKPRLLVVGDFPDSLVVQLQETLPTVDRVAHASHVDLAEYDCVLSDRPYKQIERVPPTAGTQFYSSREKPPEIYQWSQNLPGHLSVIYAVPTSAARLTFIDFWPPEGEGEELPLQAIRATYHIVGRHLTHVEGLPDVIVDLVKDQLIPIAKERKDHLGFFRGARDLTEEHLMLRPFLYGPGDVALAGSYERNDQASVWLLPDDLPDLGPWVVAALREWHELYPDRFPALADWPHHPSWRTKREIDLNRALDDRAAAFKIQIDEYFESKRLIEADIAAAQSAADSYERALLTTQGPEFESAVSRALRDLGFVVADMDEVWPDGARREDYRITDPDQPEWIAIGEAKGFTKGVSESGFQSLARSVEFFIVETGTRPSARWYIANFRLREDPATRPRILHGRDDALAAFQKSDGLLIDSRALFVLVRRVADDPSWREIVRADMRARSGLLTVADVEAIGS